MQREDYFFEESNEGRSDRLFVLVIYDIVDNKKRVKFAKYLQGYGTRIQKSAFEAHLTRKVYEKLPQSLFLWDLGFRTTSARLKSKSLRKK